MLHIMGETISREKTLTIRDIMLHIMGEIIPNKLLNIKREIISREKTLTIRDSKKI